MEPARKFRNLEAGNGRLFYGKVSQKRQKFIDSRTFRRTRKQRNETAHQSRKRNRP